MKRKDHALMSDGPPPPMQPIILDKNGTARFQANVVVRYLLDHGGLNLNDLVAAAAEWNWPAADQEQFAQLIGYSVSGYHELSYVSDESAAAAASAALQQVGSDGGGCRPDCPVHTHGRQS